MDELLKRLEAARFTGHLDIHFDRGRIISAELIHWLSNSEFAAPLPTLEAGATEEKP